MPATSAAGYMVSSLLAGRLLQILGVGGLLSVSCAVVAAALGGFALAPTWPIFVAFAALLGLGSGAIDAGLNGLIGVLVVVLWLAIMALFRPRSA